MSGGLCAIGAYLKGSVPALFDELWPFAAGFTEFWMFEGREEASDCECAWSS